ncbi:NF038122 family metalloprotease [Mastigocoleus sp. MO_188.B34]|uniref:NF038122 family metalloprotease n=1 Tax=Mastigocoleus sp. MO_188.B34 TaxID=3036635 RepID=UPI0026158BDD|nr:NF038122 family metalloprotease [Mastigocoleus sp. MO_188.B34]MDJ0694921.1 NF038122 family metalloprotease [Mastigocoleus sp. MO_188.B34]
MKINFLYDMNVSLEQMIGYEMTSLLWGQLFTDDIEINIFAKSTDQLDANIIGGAVPEYHEQHYGLFLEYFAADITSEEDQLAYDALQQGNTVDFLLNGDLVGGNTKIKLTTALAQALGMNEAISLDRYVLDDSTHFIDGTIMMNQNFAWDFNYLRDSEAAENTLDFLSVALHETGHILGFTSSLDFSLQQDTLYSGRKELTNFNPLDLFRFSAQSLAQNNPDGSVSDLSIGGVAWFSPDGGETLTAKMSTGKEGDGYQASHWERRYDPLGIMDPTLWYQERASITDLDVLAFDVMGYDLSENASEVEQLFTTEGLELILAQAKVQLADKLDVSVEWIEENGNVPVSSLDLIAQIEAEIAAASESITTSTTSDSSTTDPASDSSTTDPASESTTTSTTSDSSTTDSTTNSEEIPPKDFFKDLRNMINKSYKWWAQNNEGGNSSWQELYEWWAQNNEGGNSSWQELYEWWAQNNEGGNSSWQELYEWWAQNNEGGNSSWQELYEWWAQNNEGGNSSWQELYKWWFEANQGKDSWWQEVFFASQDNGNLEGIKLPGQTNNEVTNIIYGDITGGHEDDIIGGDTSNDNIVSGQGDDLVDGAEGDDTIIGGEGYDTIFGFDGNDSIKGGVGDDLISGESGEDVLLGEAGADVLMGGDDDDYLDGGEGRDFLNGDTGNDALIGGSGSDALEGEGGKDLLVGGEGQDIGNGGSGNDFIFGDEYSVSLEQAFGNSVSPLVNLFTSATETLTIIGTTTNEEGSNVELGLDPVKVEAENMTLSGNYSLASSETLVQTNSTATISTIFNGQAGQYNIVIGYHDVYGNARITASLGASTIDDWYLNQSSGTTSPGGSNFKTRTIASEVSLNGGESLTLDTVAYVTSSGDDDDDDFVSDKAYIDYVEFVPIVDNTNNVVLDPDPTTTDTTNTNSSTTDTSNNDTSNTLPSGVELGANSDILRGGNGNDGIDGGEGNDIIFGEDEANDSSNVAPINIAGSFNYGQSTYILTQSATTLVEAQIEAESYGGNLVTINDAAEETFLTDTFGTDRHIGLTDATGGWEWISEQAITYETINFNPVVESNYLYLMYFGYPTNVFAPDKFGIIEIEWSSVGGNDTIVGGAGDDQIYGNSGNDLIYGDDIVVDVNQGASSASNSNGDDHITGNGGNDTISGGAGNDVINGTDEVVAGYYEKDILTGGDGADKFILGDTNQAYYDTAGYQDYALIKDFDSTVDFLQLHGIATDYQQQQQGNDIFLSRNGDLIAILEDNTTLNLSDTAFEYV